MDNLLSQLIFNTNDLPSDSADGNTDFWNVISSPHYKSVCLITLLQLIPDRHPSEMTDEQCRSILSSIYTAKKFMNQPLFFKAVVAKREQDQQQPKEDILYKEDNSTVNPLRED